MTDSTTRRPRRRWLLPLIIVVVLAVGLLAVTARSSSPKCWPPPRNLCPITPANTWLSASSVSIAIPARRGATAGLPSLNKCMGCHASVASQEPKDQADINKLLKQWDSQQPVQWVKIFEQPDFVHFNHRPHTRRALPAKVVTAMSPRRTTRIRTTSTWASA